MKDTKILVTGGSGLLGSYILRWFKQQGYTSLTATCQTPETIPKDLKEGIEWSRLVLPDVPGTFDLIRTQEWVIHSAAFVSYQPGDKFKMLEINKTGTEIIVNACLAHQIKHLIYIGSIGALGKETNQVKLDESNVWLQNQYSTNYGLSKYLGELEVWRGAAEGLNVSVILPSVILGIGDWHRSSLQIVDRVANHSPWYPGGQTGFVDARDVASFVGLIIEKGISGERWLLSGANLSFKEIFGMIAEQLELNKKFRLSPKWLSKIILFTSNIKSGRLSVPEIINQVYGTFSYDASKSLTVEGFHYRPMEETIREMMAGYKSMVFETTSSIQRQ